MAKKRLNKKLLVILSLVGMAVTVIGVGLVYNYIDKDPQPYLEEAELLIEEARALEAAHEKAVSGEEDLERRYQRLRELQEGEVKEKWEQVNRSLNLALNYSRKDQDQQLEILRQMAELCWEREDYSGAQERWRRMLELEGNNYYAQRALTDYYYEGAQNSAPSHWLQIWLQVQEEAEKLIELKPDDSRGHMIKAHALIILVDMGVAEDEKGSKLEIAELLDDARQLDDKNVLAHYLQAQLAMLLSGDTVVAEEQAEFKQQAEIYFQEAVQKNPDDPEAYQNLFKAHMYPKIYEKYFLANSEVDDPNEREDLLAEAEGMVTKNLKELTEWSMRFPEEGEFYEAKGRLSELQIRGLEDLDSVIRSYEQAWERDKSRGEWYLKLAELYQLRTEYVESGREDLEKSYKWLRWGLSLPELTKIDTRAPKYPLWNRVRLGMVQLMVDVGADLSEMAETKEEKEAYLTRAEESFQELRETIGVEDPYTQMGAGALAWARDEPEQAVKYFYQADKALRLEGVVNRRLKKRLFYTLRDTEYRNLALRYGNDAFHTPKTFVDYIAAAVETVEGGQYPKLLDIINDYGITLSENSSIHKRIQAVKADILLRQEMRKEASEVLTKIDDESKEIRLLRARAQETREERIEAMAAIVREEPGEPELVPVLFPAYLMTGKEEIPPFSRARALVEAAVEADPNNIIFWQMQEMMEEPDPNNISRERQKEIAVEVLNRIDDAYTRWMELGYYYRQLAEQAGIMGLEAEGRRNWEQAQKYFSAGEEVQEDDPDALMGVIDASQALEDWDAVKNTLEKIRKKDPLMSLYYEGVLLASQGLWDEVAAPISKYLQEIPISSGAHRILAEAHARANRPEEAEAEARTAVEQNFDDVGAIQILLLLLDGKYQNDFESLGVIQISEMKDLIEKIAQIVPGDELVGQLQMRYYPLWMSYALKDIESRTEMSAEDKAKNKRQVIQEYEKIIATFRIFLERFPQREERWGQLAEVLRGYSEQVTDEKDRDRLVRQAEEVYRQGLQANPASAELAAGYGSFLQKMVRGSEAEKMFLDMIAQTSGEEKYQMQIKLGQFYNQMGELERGQAVLEEILAEAPHNKQATELLARRLANQGDYEGALELYETLRQEQDDEQLMGGRVWVYLQAGRMEEAERLVNQMQKQYPESLDVDLLRGNLALRNTEYTAAWRHADRILADNPNDIRALLLKGEALYFDQKLTEARECLEQLRRLVGDKDNTGRQLLGRIYWALGQREDAIRELRLALRLAPGNLRLRGELVIWLQQARRWGDLEEIYNEMLEQYPNSLGWHMEAARSAIQQGDYENASKRQTQAVLQYRRSLVLMQRALALSQQQGQGSMQILVEILSLLRRLGENEQVLKLVEENLQGVPTDGLLLANQAAALYGLGRNRAAWAAYEKGLNLVEADSGLSDMVLQYASMVGEAEAVISWGRGNLTERPDRTLTHLVLAAIHRSQGAYEQEISELLATRRTADEDWALYIDGQLSKAYEVTLQRDKAIEIYRRVLEKFPDNASLLNNLAYALLSQKGREKEAVSLAQKAYNLDRTNPNIMDTYAVALMQQSSNEKADNEKAELILRRAIQELQRTGQPVSAEIYYHLGQALRDLGRINEAAVEMNRALRMVPEGDVSQREASLRDEINAALKAMDRRI